MEDRALESPTERLRKLAAPLDLEAVPTERLVLGLEPGPLVPIAGQPQAADAPEGVAGEPLEPIEVALGQAPEAFGALRPEVAAGSVVGGSPPRRAKPPFRPLAPPAISRAS